MSWCSEEDFQRCGSLEYVRRLSKAKSVSPESFASPQRVIHLTVQAMQSSWFLFLLASSNPSALATPVPDEPNFESGVTLSSNPLDRDHFGESTNQRPPEASSSESASQILATNYDAKDAPLQANSEKSVDLPRKSVSDFSNMLLAHPPSTNPLPVPPFDQQPATGDSPDKAEVPSQSISTSGGTSPDWRSIPLSPLDGGPDCKGWWRLCCYGDIFYDKNNIMWISKCYPCNDSFCFFSLHLSISSKYLSTEK